MSVLPLAQHCATAAAPIARAGPDWWNVGSTLGGALVGALIAGVASFLAARLQVLQAREAATDLLKDREATGAIRTTTKLFMLSNSIEGYYQQLEGMIAEGSAELGDAHPWRYVLAFAGAAEGDISFDADDLIVYVKAKAFDLVSDLLMLSGRFRSLAAAFAIYGQKREQFLARLKAEEVDGFRGSGGLTKEEFAWAAPLMAELDHLIGQLRQAVAEHRTEAKRLCVLIGPITRDYMKDPEFPVIGLRLID